MIVFEKIKIQNFMSVGNAPIEIQYDKAPTTIVTAVNGSGKSSILMDSISFVLYGKPYRKINKPQLVNSINAKKCLIEIELSVGSKKYKIIRGIKPAVFEIYEDDELVNQDASVGDYQQYLESKILKMDYRTFTQIVIMGSSNYTPFMRLSTPDRRKFIEDILDIKVFSSMKDLLKIRVDSVKSDISELETAIRHLSEKISMQEVFIDTLKNEKKNRLDSLLEKIKKNEAEEESLQKKIDECQKKVKVLSSKITDDIEELRKQNSDLRVQHHITERSISSLEKDSSFFKENDECPTCKQHLQDDYKKHMVEHVEKEMIELENKKNEHAKQIIEIETRIEVIRDQETAISRVQSEIGAYQTSIQGLQRHTSQIRRDIDSDKEDTASVDDESKKLTKMKTLQKGLLKKKQAKNEEWGQLLVVSDMLKDSGIKARIVKQYVPVINSLVNKYLQRLDLFVSFTLNENFEETVKSRHRDLFTYESFSEGEKQRIDLALLFVFREIARLKNAVSVNLLIMDEVLDKSLDSIGVDDFFGIIGDLNKTNLFVISHRDGMTELFDESIRLIKKNNFTTIEDA